MNNFFQKLPFYTLFLNYFCYIHVNSEEVQSDSHTIAYNQHNFQDEVTKSNHFVMFYAPWCKHCQNLHPKWEELAEMLNENDSNMKIAKVDCTVETEVCSEQDITGYPTLKLYKVGQDEAIKFKGTRDLPTLTTFINEHLRKGIKTQIQDEIHPESVYGLVELTGETFKTYVSTGKHFVKFYAPWCSHCQKLAPVWEQVAKVFETNDHISINKLDCTQYGQICTQYEVRGYPTLLWIENGQKIDKYQGDRTVENIRDYITSMIGSVQTAEEQGTADEMANDVETEFDTKQFKEGIQNGITFAMFYAPWCGHCKRLAPTWNDLIRKFASKSLVRIVKIDCTVDKDLCNNEEIEGFPTMFLYKDGEKVSEYSGHRTLDDLYAFVNSYIVRDEL